MFLVLRKKGIFVDGITEWSFGKIKWLFCASAVKSSFIYKSVLRPVKCVCVRVAPQHVEGFWRDILYFF